jgi:hypothetical protein
LNELMAVLASKRDSFKKAAKEEQVDS